MLIFFPPPFHGTIKEGIPFLWIPSLFSLFSTHRLARVWYTELSLEAGTLPQLREAYASEVEEIILTSRNQPRRSKNYWSEPKVELIRAKSVGSWTLVSSWHGQDVACLDKRQHSMLTSISCGSVTEYIVFDTHTDPYLFPTHHAFKQLLDIHWSWHPVSMSMCLYMILSLFKVSFLSWPSGTLTLLIKTKPQVTYSMKISLQFSSFVSYKFLNFLLL